MNSLPRVIALSALTFMVFGAFSSPSTDARKLTREQARAGCTGVDDATLTSRVSTKLTETPALAGQDIRVEARAGVVTLTGTVSSNAKRQLAARTAAGVTCVRRVNNRLVVKVPFRADTECCCDGMCWQQTGRCPICPNIATCVEEYKAALAASGGKKDAIAAAQEAFAACRCRSAQ